MIEIEAPALADQEARTAALDTSRSFLVQAPAGAGKTELLTRRFLKLLAEVDEPEQVVAITFTRLATAEMRARVLDALREVQRESQRESRESDVQERDRDSLSALASAAIKNDAARGWRLLEQPQRLNIQTIDSLCLAIAYKTPLLSRLGGNLTPVEIAAPLYALAARRTLARLGGERQELSSAIRALLAMRDASLSDCEQLVAGMLEKRDQWGRILPLAGEPGWEEVRSALEAPFRRARQRLIERARNLVAREAAVANELLDLLTYACGNLETECPGSPLLLLKGITRIEEIVDREQWARLCGFLLTKKTWRKRVDKRDGFPSGKPGCKERQDRFKDLIAALKEKEGALELFRDLRIMPPAEYSTEQWRMLEHILLILRYAAAELRVIFAERNVVDFVELGIAARQALRGDPEDPDAALPAAQQWRHLLVDEFQDTSRGQYELLTLLVDQWDPAERNTCFLVGDPMQSVYGFRDAEVELFERTRRHGLGERLRLEPLVLQTNFRSHAGLVVPLNKIFASIFAADPARDRYQVAFEPSAASEPAPPGAKGVCVKAQFLQSGMHGEEVQVAVQAEAEEAVDVIRKVLAAGKDRENFRVAVLVRARKHLAAIARKLQAVGIPYRAVEIEQLGERQEVRDLAALTCALLHPMDRIAWLSVLRAPWCGLSLRDLHILCGSDERALRQMPVLQLLRMRLPLLSSDGQLRASRVAAVLEDALLGKQRQAFFSPWLERVWRSLGGRECVDPGGYENVRAFLCMLEDLPVDGSELEERIERLFAEPDPRANELSGVQLMTIHKAKGLGFDVVLVPGLQNQTGDNKQPLLHWLERTVLEGPDEVEQREFLVVPIGRKGGKTDALYHWVGRQKESTEVEEAKRLLYVAATRARSELYFLGAVTVKSPPGRDESITPGGKRSLLKTAWPGLGDAFLAQREHEQRRPSSGGTLPFPEFGASAIGSQPPSPPKTIQLRRLPADWKFPIVETTEAAKTVTSLPNAIAAPRLDRPAGSLKARALGVTAHELLEELTACLSAASARELGNQLDSWRPRAMALLRQAGLSRSEAGAQSPKVIALLKSALEDETGRWILTARREADTETSWSVSDGSNESGAMLGTLRGDRTFRAGAEPLSEGETHFWIVDYKTATHSGTALDAFLEKEKAQYKQQLETYGTALRMVRGETISLRLALYYPLLKKLVWWAA